MCCDTRLATNVRFIMQEMQLTGVKYDTAAHYAAIHYLRLTTGYARCRVQTHHHNDSL